MEAAMAMEADSWLEEKKTPDSLEHQYSLRPDQLVQSVDDMELLQAADESANPDEPDGDTDTAVSPFKVTMYQCAQCKTAFSTLDMCIHHQCSMTTEPAADSTQPRPEQQQQQQPQSSQQAQSQQQQQSQSHSAVGQNLQQLDPDNQGCNHRWGHHDTLAFLEILTSNVDKFSNPNIKRKFIWKDACDQMLEKKFTVSQLQCENRWKTLKAMWRKSQSSGSRPPFFREMCDIAERYPVLMTDISLGAGDPGRTERTAPMAHAKVIWTREASLTMLALLKGRHTEYSDPSIKRRFFWTEISDAMRDLGMEYTPEQCEGRMKTLLQAYRRAQLRWDSTGEGAASDCYYQVDELIRLIPELAGGAAGRAAAGAVRGPPAVGQQRRRRSGRAARQRDLVTWLDGWIQEQRRWDETVQATLRAQHAERLRVLEEIRDELRTGGARVPQTRAPLQLPPLPQQKLSTAAAQEQTQDDTVVAQVFLT